MTDLLESRVYQPLPQLFRRLVRLTVIDFAGLTWSLITTCKRSVVTSHDAQSDLTQLLFLYVFGGIPSVFSFVTVLQ